MGIKQAWKALFQKNEEEEEKRTNKGHSFNEEDRYQSAEIRRMRQESARLQSEMSLMRQKYDLEKLRADLYGDDEEEEEEEENELDMVTKLFTGIIGNSQARTTGGGNVSEFAQPPHVPPQMSNTDLSINDDEIRKFIATSRKEHVILAKTLPKSVVKEKIKKELLVNEATAERAHNILMAEF